MVLKLSQVAMRITKNVNDQKRQIQQRQHNDHKSSSVPFDMAAGNSALNLPKIFKKMTTEDLKRWSLVENNGVENWVVIKTNLLDSCLGRKTEWA